MTFEVFAGVVRIVLLDGQLTQEEKRLLISIVRSLDLDDGEPSRVYEAVLAGEEVKGGQRMTKKQCTELYESAIEVAYSNFDLSRDEDMLFAHLEEMFGYIGNEREDTCKKIRKQLEARITNSGGRLRRAKKKLLGNISRKILKFGKNGESEEALADEATSAAS